MLLLFHKGSPALSSKGQGRGGLVSSTHTGCAALSPTSRRLAVNASGIDVFYGLRPIDLPRARRVLIEESRRNKKGEEESCRGVASSACHPRDATHTEKKERPEASENVSQSLRRRFCISSSR